MENILEKEIISDEEIQKYVILTRLFFCKVIECIYHSRCPKELSDFFEDTERWFSLDIPQSQALRKLIGGEAPYGWFKLDVVLSDSNCVIERWIISNKDYKPTDSRPILTGDCKNIKVHIYRCFSKMMRSLFATMNMMPAKVLELQIKNMVSSCVRMKAFCTHFMELPVKVEPISSNYDTFEINFGDVSTPIGISNIRCYTVRNPSKFIPSLVNNEKPLNNSSFQFQKLTIPSDYSSSFETESLIRDDSFGHSSYLTNGSNENEDNSHTSDFISYLSNLNISFEMKQPLDDLKQRLIDLEKKAKELKDDWNESGLD